MPRAVWPLHHGRPRVQLTLTLAAGAKQVVRDFLVDTGAGTARSSFDLILDERDCILCGGIASSPVRLGRVYTGFYPVYLLRAQIPELAFDQYVRTVGVTTVPAPFHGIACLAFLNRFAYGNFGDPGQFGMEYAGG